jgi:chromosome segregation and condensation protein ScpB
LLSPGRFRDDSAMAANYKSSGPVTLTEEQILALHQKLRDMRHDVNGRLANIVAAAELMRLRPDQSMAERLKLLLEQPHKASESLSEFSHALESTLGLTRR